MGRRDREARIAVFVTAVVLPLGAWSPPPTGSSPSARRRSAATRNSLPACSIATAGCCAPMPWPTAAGGCRRRDRQCRSTTVSRLLFAYEDKRFRAHRGVDPLALMRAALQLATSGHIRIRRLDLHHAGGAAHRAAQRPQFRCQTAPDRARHRDRARSEQGRDARSLSRPRALWRQSRGHSRRFARLFRQGAAAALARRSGTAGRSAAIAGSAPAGSLRRRRALGARPRARPLCGERAACRPTRSRSAKAEPVPRRGTPMPMLAPHASDRAVAQAAPGSEVKLTIDAELQKNLGSAGAGTRAHARRDARARRFARHRRRRQRDAAKCLARVGSPDYFDQRRAGEVDHDAGAALARFDAQAFHLRPRLRGRLHPSRDIDRRPAGALRRLRAAEFRFHVPRHRLGAPGAANVAQRAGACRARSGRGEPSFARGSPRPAPRWCCRRAKRRVSPSASAVWVFACPIW